MPTVFANGRSILHAGDGLQHVAAPPDVCKTPSPGGPVPIPYVNMAMDSDLAKGAKNVKIEGKSVALESSNLSTSTGDEPGTAGGGLMSSKTKGKMTWATASADVKFEGKGVARFMDVTQHNGNSFNTAFQSMGGTGLAYADDFKGPCAICSKGPKEHRVLETPRSVKICKELIHQLDSGFQAQTTDEGRMAYARPGRGSFSGYMVGVMICRCKRAFAAMSGYTVAAFAGAAGRAGAAPIVGGAATRAELIGANVWPDRAKAARAINGTCDRIDELLDADDAGDAAQGYNPPGQCAGAKLMARAGHAPVEMTEMFFMPRNKWVGTYKCFETTTKSWKDKILQNKIARKRWFTFTGGESVASCHTCQELLYLTNCPERVCP